MNSATARYEALLRDHVAANLSGVLKSPKAALKHPFIDPGSIYDGNLWDWDSFWATYGILNLIGDGVPAEREAECLEHARGNVLNFLDNQLEDGYIPMMIELRDGDLPYLIGKHREGVVMNMAKPFLCQQAALISSYTGDIGWLRPHREGLERYFACYDSTYFNDNCKLYVWADDIMIGMDNDPASFGRPRFSTANIFLNSFMEAELRAMGFILSQLGDDDAASAYGAKADALASAIQAECWDERDGFFYSVDVDIKTRKFDWFHVGLGVFWKTLPIKVRTWSGFLPLWAHFATPRQADRLLAHARDAGTFACDYGITSLAKDERMFNVSATSNPSNWLGPVWIVANYAVFRGLLDYGFTEAAQVICEETLTLLGRDLERSGTLHEYYAPASGEPVMNGGFINWNILALNMADELRGKPAMDSAWRGPAPVTGKTP